MWFSHNIFIIIHLICVFKPATFNSDTSSTNQKLLLNPINKVVNIENKNKSGNVTKDSKADSLFGINGSHKEREHVIEPPSVNITATSNNVIHPKSENIKPVYETVISNLDIAPQQDDAKPSVPKKGVSFTDLDPSFRNDTDINKINGIDNNTQNAPSNNSAPKIPTKPLFTESDDDYIDTSKLKNDTSKERLITIDQIDPVLVKKETKRSNYIVPIVAVILSVPLVAILMSILYKRGTDWWQHRNYKRMDFLIEGMYHN